LRAGGFRRNKFGAKKTPCGQGHTHDSKREAARCDKLHQLEADGYITDLELQPQFYFDINGTQVKHDNGRRVGYKADFLYTDSLKALALSRTARAPRPATGRSAKPYSRRSTLISF
jgi:hypothetical protein